MSSFTSFVLLFIATATAIVSAKEYQVGDAVGWRIPATNETELYTTWASRRKFHIGDSLRFRYSTSSVVLVDKYGYYHCDSSHPISYFNDGDTVVNLDKEGTYYFISGNSDRCQQGQRMILNVKVDVQTISPSIADPPYNPYSAMGPSPSQVASFGPVPQAGSAVLVSVSGVAYVVAVAGIGLSLVKL
ncbi:hypothetical protein QVD17_11047 [Tagetes erecta]|uniref:Phytocyanin domain-containing protein n=1 Tax=Tagetes erecta TaxID=13708 RepID=A0AAD8L2B0_TARER|nr:hypothetical protein QVD17_11047 [Tagetes erecta]